MKSKTKNTTTTIIIILAIALIAIFALTKKPAETDEELVKCIGSKSVLYTQLGCHFCEAQKDLFGENIKHISVIDCWYEPEPCTENNITSIPTWIIKNEKYEGLQTIDKLKELTGC